MSDLATRDAEYMERALRQAELAIEHGQMPFGAVVVDAEGRFLAEGHSTTRADLDPSAHGEIVAIRNACRTLGDWVMPGCTLYSSTEPCLLCSFVLSQAAFARVVYAARGTDVPDYKPLLGIDLSGAARWINDQPDWPPLEVVGEVMRDRAKEILARVWPAAATAR